MIRRRRPTREIAFSFDSFLDVVANVVGIIIRLILVAWVGARSYSSLNRAARPGAAAARAVARPLAPPDPLHGVLARHQTELERAHARLLAQLQQLKLLEGKQGEAKERLAGLAAREEALDKESATVARDCDDRAGSARRAALSLAELEQRQRRLLADLRALEKLPPPGHVLHYRTPVSQPVEADQFFFECRAGRVTFIDIASLLEEAHHGLEDRAKELRNRWQVTGVAGPIGAFRLHYTLEREHGALDAVVPGAAPVDAGGFRYELSRWVVEPVAALRGESLAEALGQASEFRRITDRLDPRQAVVTFWVYPESFALFRGLRDHLYDRGLVVAGRPLPESVPVTATRNGSLSRGQ